MLLSSRTAGRQGKEKDSHPTAQTALFSTKPPVKAARSTALPPLHAWATTSLVSSSRQDRQRLNTGAGGRRSSFRRTPWLLPGCDRLRGQWMPRQQSPKSLHTDIRWPDLLGCLHLSAVQNSVPLFNAGCSRGGSQPLPRAQPRCPPSPLRAATDTTARPPLPTWPQSLEHPQGIDG